MTLEMSNSGASKIVNVIIPLINFSTEVAVTNYKQCFNVVNNLNSCFITMMGKM